MSYAVCLSALKANLDRNADPKPWEHTSIQYPLSVSALQCSQPLKLLSPVMSSVEKLKTAPTATSKVIRSSSNNPYIAYS